MSAVTTSEPRLRVVKDDVPRFKATRVALEMEGHLDSDPWALGDALLEDVTVAEATVRTKGGPSGLYAELDEIREEMLDYGALTVAKSSATVREAYKTARAWPVEYRRPELATYRAHARFTTSEISAEQRANKLERLHRQAKRRVTVDDVRLWRESQKRAAGTMPAPLSRSELLDRRLRSSLKAWASPQTFDQLHPDERDTAIKTLRSLANAIERGVFS